MSAALRTLTLAGPNPGCDICEEPAMCDVPTSQGPWAHLCTRHNDSIGQGSANLGHAVTWTG